jgi:hypothetical protein
MPRNPHNPVRKILQNRKWKKGKGEKQDHFRIGEHKEMVSISTWIGTMSRRIYHYTVIHVSQCPFLA